MHMTDWAEAQGEDALLVTCRKGMRTRKDVGHCWMLDSVGHLQERDAHKKGCCSAQKRDAFLKRCMGEHSDSEEG